MFLLKWVDGAFLFCVHAVNIVTGPLLHVMNIIIVVDPLFLHDYD